MRKRDPVRIFFSNTVHLRAPFLNRPKENEMAPLAVNRKRKQAVKEPSDAHASDAEHFPDGELDLLSGDEEEDEPAQESESDEIDAFPEIDTGSDTDDEEEEESPDENEDDSESEDEKQYDEDASSSDDLRIFPKAKTVISDITGQAKKVYPEIEPDYDSDSSTEDVRAFPDTYLFWPTNLPTILFERHQIASEIYRFIGMTTCLMWGTILMARKFSNRHVEMSWTNS